MKVLWIVNLRLEQAIRNLTCGNNLACRDLTGIGEV